MKRILITGGAGFIGSHAIEYFLAHYPDYHIINMDKMTYASSMENMASFQHYLNYSFIKGDIADKKTVESIFKEYAISDVIHFAAESHVDNSIAGPEVFVQTNIVGTFTLLEAARKIWSSDNNRFYHISTDEVYGSLGESGIFNEDSPYRPNSPYSASKASSDLLVRSYIKTYGLNAVMSNCSNNYGPRQHPEKFIPTVIRRALAGEAIPIYGSGKNVRDWLYVRDHCAAIDKVFHHAKAGEQFAIGGENELSNMAVALFICEYLNEIAPLSVDYRQRITYVADRQGHDFRYAISNDKIKNTLGWVPETAFQEGLKGTIEYYVRSFEGIEA